VKQTCGRQSECTAQGVWQSSSAGALKQQEKSKQPQLFNEGRHAMSTVRFKYDPLGHAGHYLHVLSVEMAHANGAWPFSLENPRGNGVVDRDPHGKSSIGVGQEDFRLSAGDMR
jgi:hypothetical protein